MDSSKVQKRKRSDHGGGRDKGRPNGHRRPEWGSAGRAGKRKEMGRSEWARRERNDDSKRRRLDKGEDGKPVYAVEFSKEEIEGEERKPKRKVAVMIGYSGSGYKGMQLNDKEKTIEGDLFQAFVAAGAVSKANANDPKKSSLVRCARTDKGVHAAGNVISMKLIIEDEDIVQKINANLSPQIRVWGIERTNGSFSAYQLCDSRIYEYLIPTHCFLPPHPETYIAKKLVELADEAGDRDGYEKRQEEVSSFWSDAEERYIKPILDGLDPGLRHQAIQVMFHSDTAQSLAASEQRAGGPGERAASPILGAEMLVDADEEGSKHGRDVTQQEIAAEKPPAAEDAHTVSSEEASQPQPQKAAPRTFTPLELAIRSLRAAQVTAKKAYRIDGARLARVRSCLSRFAGTHSYHNYTIHKTHKDASAKRSINSFTVDDRAVLIGSTEWLSLKVHGQSFMMHQIRKMVSMCALVVRTGSDVARIRDSFGPARLSVPKAPGLGLLLERPVFDTYNERLRFQGETKREKVGFEKFEAEMAEFKQREIYERIFREEEREGVFHALFAAIDQVKGGQFLYLSSLGVEATTRRREEEDDGKGQGARRAAGVEVAVESEEEDDEDNEEGG